MDVFFCDMGARDDVRHDNDWRILSENERARATRFRFDSDRHMFVGCRAVLRRLLAQQIDARPEALVFAYGSRGKPFLPEAGIRFNASHAGQWFACAISTGGPVGIDIEHVHPLDDMMSMANHFFAPAEVKRLMTIPESQRTESFFECWTRKEAVIKATGEGVSRPLDSFEVSFGPNAQPRLVRIDDQIDPGWPMQTFAPAPDYVAALTAFEPWTDVRIKRL